MCFLQKLTVDATKFEYRQSCDQPDKTSTQDTSPTERPPVPRRSPWRSSWGRAVAIWAACASNDPTPEPWITKKVCNDPQVNRKLHQGHAQEVCSIESRMRTKCKETSVGSSSEARKPKYFGSRLNLTNKRITLFRSYLSLSMNVPRPSDHSEALRQTYRNAQIRPTLRLCSSSSFRLTALRKNRDSDKADKTCTCGREAPLGR